VDVGESDTSVHLLWLARVGDCSNTGDRGQLEELRVDLDAPLGDREVLDGVCAVQRPTEDCTVEVTP
jgi:hypothetical protein